MPTPLRRGSGWEKRSRCGRNRVIKHKQYTDKYRQDWPEIQNWSGAAEE